MDEVESRFATSESVEYESCIVLTIDDGIDCETLA